MWLYVLKQIDSGDNEDKVLVFFKLRPTVITEENVHRSILVASVLESPITTLYQALRQVFAPVLLKVCGKNWSGSTSQYRQALYN